MNKEFVNYKQALALKELGFNEPCFGFFIENGEWIPASYSKEGTVYPSNSHLLAGWVSSPLKQQAFRWFRDKHKIEAAVACYYSKILGISYEGRQYHCHIVRDGITTKGPKFKTYEEAESVCIDKLIEIVKENGNK